MNEEQVTLVITITLMLRYNTFGPSRQSYAEAGETSQIKSIFKAYVNRCLLPGSRPSGLSLLPLVSAPVCRLLDVEAVDLGLDGLEVALAALVDDLEALKEVVQLPGKFNRT